MTTNERIRDVILSIMEITCHRIAIEKTHKKSKIKGIGYNSIYIKGEGEICVDYNDYKITYTKRLERNYSCYHTYHYDKSTPIVIDSISSEEFLCLLYELLDILQTRILV